MSRGIFLTLEGLDGSGKTTQIQRLDAWLRRRGIEPVVTRQPGGTLLGDRIRALMLDAKSAELSPNGISPQTELALMFADRAQAIHEVIQPALSAGKTVLCDRFTDSTEAYQGGGRELGSEIVLQMHKLICGTLKPDLTLLLLPDLSASLTRARRRNARTNDAEGRFEQEQDAFFSRVHAKYKEIAAREPDRVISIEDSPEKPLSIDEVHERIVAAVATRLRDID